jgi:hypothetical protein
MRKLILSVVFGASLLSGAVSMAQAQVLGFEPLVGPPIVVQAPKTCIGPVCS